VVESDGTRGNPIAGVAALALGVMVASALVHVVAASQQLSLPQ
jgi:hypothetical protein